MRQTLLPLVLSAALSSVVLAACSPDREPAAEAGATASGAAAGADAGAQAAGSKPSSVPEPGEGGDTPVSNAADDGDAQARFDGYGDLRLGMPVAGMPAAWGGELAEVGKDFNGECYFLTPTWAKVPAEFAFMIEAGRFVRYGTESSTFTAPGGGKVGMTAADIATLYPGRIEEQPHKYSDGNYLRIKDSAGDNALLFETDGAGHVTEWRVGMPPQVDYVEGCS